MTYKINNCFIIIIFTLSTLFFLNTCSLDDIETVRAPPPENVDAKRERERDERSGRTAENETFIGNIFKGLTGTKLYRSGKKSVVSSREELSDFAASPESAKELRNWMGSIEKAFYKDQLRFLANWRDVKIKKILGSIIF